MLNQLAPLDDLLLFSDTNGCSNGSGSSRPPPRCEWERCDTNAEQMIHFALNIKVIFTQRGGEAKKGAVAAASLSLSPLIEQNN